MIYLEDPIQALIYDSLPDPPGKETLSNVFLSNLTEGGLDNIHFKVGTPLHYLVVQSLDEESVESDVLLPDDEDVIDGDGDTSLSNGTNSTNATSTLLYQNETDLIINYTNTNETITASSTTNITNSTTVLDRRTPSLLPSWDETPVSSPETSTSSSLPTREISGEYTDIVHHNPQSSTNNFNADIFIAGSDGKTLTITEFLGYFNDSKLIFTEEEYVYYDSRQARFGTDLGPKGNAEFVNIMLPPRWGDVEDSGVDLGEMGEGLDKTVVINYVVDEEETDAAEYVDVQDSTGNAAANNTNGTIEVNEMESTQDDEELVRMRALEDLLDHPMGVEDENLTIVTAVDANSTVEDNQPIDNVTTIDSSNASVNQTTNETAPVDDIEISGFNFDTHISSYFCLDDFVNWRSKLSGAIAPPASVLPSPSNMVQSTRGIALLVQRGRCSFEDKAKLAMVLNDILASENKSNRIDHIIVYNNGTIDKNNNGTDGEEQLIEMLQVPLWNGTYYQNTNAVNVGMLYIATASGIDLMKRISERQKKLGISPYMDMFWLRGRHLISESTKDDGQNIGRVEESTAVHDNSITNGWFFPATLTRFCLSCGKELDYGFYPFLPMEGGSQYRPGQFGGPSNIWPFSDDYVQPQRWVEMVRRLMIAVLVLLLVGPLVLATHRWHTVGGTIRMTTDENGRRRVRIISPTLEVFVEGVPDAVETNGTKLDRAQVFSLPEIVYRPPSSAGDSSTSVNEDDASPLVSTQGSDVKDAKIESSDSFQENDSSQDNITSSAAPITPPGSVADDMMFSASACCSICIEEFEAGEKVRVLPRCKHLFHIDCIMPWLTERQGCCPQCRTPVLPEEFQRSRRSSPLRSRSSSVLGRFRRERRQESEESDSALTPARLFTTEIEDDLGGDDTMADTAPQDRGNAVPYGVEETERQSSNAEDENHSPPEIMEQGLVSGETTSQNHIGIAATVSTDDIDSSVRESSPGEAPERNVAIREVEGDPSDSDDGYAAFLNFLRTPNVISQGNGGNSSGT